MKTAALRAIVLIIIMLILVITPGTNTWAESSYAEKIIGLWELKTICISDKESKEEKCSDVSEKDRIVLEFTKDGEATEYSGTTPKANKYKVEGSIIIINSDVRLEIIFLDGEKLTLYWGDSGKSLRLIKTDKKPVLRPAEAEEPYYDIHCMGTCARIERDCKSSCEVDAALKNQHSKLNGEEAWTKNNPEFIPECKSKCESEYNKCKEKCKRN